MSVFHRDLIPYVGKGIKGGLPRPWGSKTRLPIDLCFLWSSLRIDMCREYGWDGWLRTRMPNDNGHGKMQPRTVIGHGELGSSLLFRGVFNFESYTNMWMAWIEMSSLLYCRQVFGPFWNIWHWNEFLGATRVWIVCFAGLSMTHNDVFRSAEEWDRVAVQLRICGHVQWHCYWIGCRAKFP